MGEFERILVLVKCAIYLYLCKILICLLFETTVDNLIVDKISNVLAILEQALDVRNPELVPGLVN